MKSVLADRLFHLKENGTTVRRECFAGLTTFVTMAYILAVNPAILGAAGMDRGAVFTASALAACAATLLMALLSNYPFALAPGMGLNAYFAYTVVIKQGYSWQMALAAVFLEGLLFIVLSVTSVREAIFNSIPRPLKLGVTWGIGLFILFIGLQNSKLIVADPSTMLSVYPFREAIASGEIRSVGLGAVLAFAGILLTAILTIRRVRGALLLGILAVWGAAILCQLTGLYVPNAELGMASVLPDFSAGLAGPSLAPTFMQMDFTGLFTLNFLTVVLSFLFVDVFDTLGGIIGMASQGHMLDENGRLPRIRGALLSDADGFFRSWGIPAVTTKPAEPSLHQFFGRNGFRECFVHGQNFFHWEKADRNPGAVKSLERLSPGEYTALRESWLAETPHIAIPEEMMGYQAGACALTPGGGLYALAAPRGRAALCAEGMENGKLLVKELLCAPEDRDWVLECLPSLLPHWCMTYRVPEGSQPFAMLKWLDPEVEAAWDWSSTAYLGLAFD